MRKLFRKKPCTRDRATSFKTHVNYYFFVLRYRAIPATLM
ncbi:hypothetical protein GGR27_000355 [Lewinella antarctica]|uniref:Uncharacterized protein n=1 Tax=Neolewinella antarctica TaxID=442734 RepID=A0ABX0X7A8_9BACT|nr:hypothetical protein [Neolewinella antarctica]